MYYEIILGLDFKEYNFLVNPDNIFTGDLLLNGSAGRTDLPGGNPDLMRDSLNRLSKLPGKLLMYPGHGKSISLDKAIDALIYE